MHVCVKKATQEFSKIKTFPLKLSPPSQSSSKRIIKIFINTHKNCLPNRRKTRQLAAARKLQSQMKKILSFFCSIWTQKLFLWANPRQWREKNLSTGNYKLKYFCDCRTMVILWCWHMQKFYYILTESRRDGNCRYSWIVERGIKN